MASVALGQLAHVAVLEGLEFGAMARLAAFELGAALLQSRMNEMQLLICICQ